LNASIAVLSIGADGSARLRAAHANLVTLVKSPMSTVSLFDAKTHLSGLIEQIVSGAETEITIARHGRPVARLVPVAQVDTANRIGIAEDLFEVPDNIDTHNAEITRLMTGGG
jgi:prevent-host-death family protein